MSVKKILNDTQLFWGHLQKARTNKIGACCLFTWSLTLFFSPILVSAESSFFFMESMDAKAEVWSLEEDDRIEFDRPSEVQRHLAEGQDAQKEKVFDGAEKKWF